MLESVRLGFVGAGSMTQALLEGLLRSGRISPAQVTVANRSDDSRLDLVRRRFGVAVTRSKRELAERADFLILAVKPSDLGGALRELAPFLGRHHRLLSLAAGIPTSAIEGCLPLELPVVRAMPNTSSRVFAAATALCGGKASREEDLLLAEEMFSTVGRVVRVPEEYLDAVTAVSGSGPAYVYYFAEALLEAASALGLEEDLGRRLVVQSLLGAAKMLAETGEDPQTLRRQVTSPRGTTQAAIEWLEGADFKGLVREAVLRAAERARELATLCPVSP